MKVTTKKVWIFETVILEWYNEWYRYKNIIKRLKILKKFEGFQLACKVVFRKRLFSDFNKDYTHLEIIKHPFFL